MGNLTNLEWKKYVCSLDSKQIYPTASYLSRDKYRQRFADRKEFGDMSMSDMAFDADTVEELKKSYFAKFITFFANDCDYSGSTNVLIVNWVHSLF